MTVYAHSDYVLFPGGHFGYLCELLAEISTILDFCGGHSEISQLKYLLNDNRVSSIGFMISGFSSTRINIKTL